jgi:integrase
MDAIVKMKGAETERRWLVAIKDKAFDSIRHNPLLETRSEHLLHVLQTGCVSTNVYLRRLHNFALDMSWLPGPILPRRCWPKVKFKEKRAITLAEHQRIVEREGNPERRAFYEMCWHLGGSQTDMACLRAEDINWPDRMISYTRRKTGELAQIQFGEEMEKALAGLPQSGPLFPNLRTVRSGDRANEFRKRCAGLGIQGITLHGYRYSWAQRAKDCGFPERFAMQMLGHGSKAIHRAYSKTSHVRVPSLEQYEQAYAKDRLIPVDFQIGKIKTV